MSSATLSADALALATALDAAPVMVRTPRGRILHWSAGMVPIYGYTAREAVGRISHELLSTVFPEPLDGIEHRLREHGVWAGELTHRHKSGAAIAVASRWTLQAAAQDAASVIEVSADITARLAAEHAVNENERRYRAAFEQAAVGMAEVGLDGRWLRVNGRLCEMVGYTRTELERLTFQQITYPPDIDRDLAFLQQLIAGEIPMYRMEKRYIRKDGSVIWVELNVALQRDADGVPDYALSVMRDITGQKMAAAALVESEERYRTLFEVVPLSLIVVDPQTLRFHAFNSQAHESLGYSRAEFARLTLRDLDANLATPALEALPPVTMGVSQRFATRHRTKDGMLRDVLVVARQVESGGVPQMLTATTDITELSEARRALEKLNAELEDRVEDRTRRLEDANRQLEAFAYSIAHDLRAPLRTMSGFAEALVEDYGDALDPTARSYALRVCDGARRLDGLIEDLLNYSRLGRDTIQLAPIDIGSVIDEVMIGAGAVIRERDVQVFIERPLPVVLGHRSLLVQIFANLISNAVKYSNPGSAPRIRISAQSMDPGWVRIWVTDEGIGINPAFHERIFEVFQRLHSQKAYPGTGIGLAIVRRAAERLGGSVGVESEPGRGSRFWVCLKPAAPEVS